MMKYITVIVLSFFVQTTLIAQELSVKLFSESSTDLTARTNPRKDLNGDDCALVKVQIASTNAKFEGSIMGDVTYNTSEYFVYMPQGSKRLKVKMDGVLPAEINFVDYGIKLLSSKTTYKMVLSLTKSTKGPVMLTAIAGDAQEKPEYHSYPFLLDGSKTEEQRGKWFGYNSHENSVDEYVIFKSVMPIAADGYILTTGDDTKQLPNRNWITWTLYGANFKSDSEATLGSNQWIVIDNHYRDHSLPTENSVGKLYEITSKGRYQYYMIRVNEVVGKESEFCTVHQMCRFSFILDGTPADVSLKCLGGTIGEWDNNQTYSSLFTKESKWCSKTKDGSIYDFVIMKANEKVVPTKYTLMTGDDSGDGLSDRNWASWELLGGNFDNDSQVKPNTSSWKVLNCQCGYKLPDESLKEVEFPLDEQNAYQYYMLRVFRVNKRNHFENLNIIEHQIQEFRLIQ